MSTLFISHISQDKEAAAELKRRLDEKGHRSVFLDLLNGVLEVLGHRDELFDDLGRLNGMAVILAESVEKAVAVL